MAEHLSCKQGVIGSNPIFSIGVFIMKKIKNKFLSFCNICDIKPFSLLLLAIATITCLCSTIYYIFNPLSIVHVCNGLMILMALATLVLNMFKPEKTTQDDLNNMFLLFIIYLFLMMI